MAATAELSQIIERIVYLPSAPDVATRIAQLAEDPRSCASDIARAVKKDPSTAARVLRLVNSSYFGLRNEIKTLTHAISILGLKVIRSVALSVSVVGSFRKMKVPAMFNHRAFWEHSALTACLARTIAKDRRLVDAEVVSDVCLLHDIGKLILACYAPAEFGSVVKIAREEGLSFLDAEAVVMQTNHTEVGGWLARQWHFSADLVHGISRHHDAVGASEDPLIAVCQFANALAKAKGFRTAGSHERVTVPKGVYQCLRITDSDVTRLFAVADEEIERSRQLLAVIQP